MKMFKTLRVASVLALSVVSPLVAADSSSLHVNVPFAFVVSGQKLPAGDYVIDTQSNAGIVMIQGQGRGVIVLSTPAFSKGYKPGLKFQQETDGEHLMSVQGSDAMTRQISQTISAKGKVAALAAIAAK